MINVTLDMTSIIDLENGKGDARYVKCLMKLHEKGKINLRVVAISASEQKHDRTYTSNFSEFKNRISAVGLGRAEILKPLGYLGVTYFDWCVVADEKNDPMMNLERNIHETLFPEIQFSYKEFCRKNGIDINIGQVNSMWRNRKCDVLALWSHIYYGSGIFVTSDGNFHKPMKKRALIALGAGKILMPRDAVVQVTSHVDRFKCCLTYFG